MPMSVTYTNYNGRIVAENRGGTETLFLPDTLGNVIETRDMDTGAKTSETTYWPYGEIRTQTGTNPSPWGFCGIWGYYSAPNLPTYVRARYYRPAEGRWQTVDPLWPTELAMSYTSQPNMKVDPEGTQSMTGVFDSVYSICRTTGPIMPLDFSRLIESLGGCAENARRDSNAWTEFRSSALFPNTSPRGDTPRNAVDHCTSACWASLVCGRKAADEWLNGRYELPDRLRGRTIDVDNNNAGLDCADLVRAYREVGRRLGLIISPSPDACFDCCKQKYFDKQLRYTR